MSCHTCNGFVATHRLRGPTNVWYAVGFQPSCGDCNLPARLAIHRLLGDEVKKLNADLLPEIKFERNSESLDEAQLLVYGNHLTDFLKSSDAVKYYA